MRKAEMAGRPLLRSILVSVLRMVGRKRFLILFLVIPSIVQ